jgi:hypothetical protein
MSVLSQPQGTPERVWSIIGGLSALGGELDRNEFVDLLNPGYMRAGEPVKAAATLASNATGVASALGLYERDGAKVRLSAADQVQSPAAFADHVHDILTRCDENDLNRVIFEAYAWLVAESARLRDLGWLFEVGQEEFADRVDAGLEGRDDDGRLMNSTKITPWRRWLRYLGLGEPMPDRTADFPSPARRIAIELGRAGLAPGTTVAADEFLRLVAARCPYLDRGRLFLQACQRIGFTPTIRTLSPLLSCGLRDLEADGVLALTATGDAADNFSVAGDPVAFGASFNAVTLLGKARAA